MKDICISVAHSLVSPGVEIKELDLNEHIVSDEQSSIVADYLKMKGYSVDLFDMSGEPVSVYREEKPIYVKKNGPYKLVLELHHNSCLSDNVQYATAIYYLSNKFGKQVCESILDELAEVLPWGLTRDGETRAPWPHTWINRNRAWFITDTGPSTALIIEAGFFRNGKKTAPGAIEFYGSPANREAEALAVAKGIENIVKL